MGPKSGERTMTQTEQIIQEQAPEIQGETSSDQRGGASEGSKANALKTYPLEEAAQHGMAAGTNLAGVDGSPPPLLHFPFVSDLLAEAPPEYLRER